MYWICAGLRAAYRPFWFDELVTWHIARLPDVGAIWAALCDGADQQMPLTHLSVRLSHFFWGSGYVATRLPALAGFWIMLLALYVFLRRRLPQEYALIGMVFPMLTFAWSYAFEARAYGVVLGCAAVGLVAWQNVSEGRLRGLSLAGIALSLAVAVGSHPFGVMIAIPIALGEAMRALERRRLDLPVWLALAAGASAIAIYPSILAATRDWSMNDMQPRLSGLPDFYDVMLRPAIAPLLFAVLAVCLLARRKPEVWAPDPILPRHEAAALLGYIVAPAVFFLGSLVTKHFVFFPRYGLFCIIGLACGSVVVLFRATGGDGRAGKVVLVILVAWLAAARGREAIAMAQDPRLGFEGENPLLVRALATGRRVVMIDPVKFLAGDFYLPDAGRLYYVTVDRDTARQYAWQDLLDQLMKREGRDLPLRAHVEPWKSFAGRNPSFLLHVGDPRECLHDVLLRGGWRLSLISHKGTEWLYDVTAPVDESSR